MRDTKQTPRTVAAYCMRCKGHRVLDVKGICHSIPIHHGIPVDEYREETILGACTECEQPILVQNWSSRYDPSESGTEYRTLYPKDTRSARTLQFELPQQISKSYHEAVKCEKSQAWNACVVMVGRALEAVARNYDSKVRTIATGIKKMHKAGAISEELFEWANELRLLRNIGAHASEKDVEELDAREALDFLQAILETIYHLRPMFQKRKERKITSIRKK